MIKYIESATSWKTKILFQICFMSLLHKTSENWLDLSPKSLIPLVAILISAVKTNVRVSYLYPILLHKASD